VAKMLLQLRLHRPAARDSDSADIARGKAVMVSEDQINTSESNEGYISIAMLLSLLKQPLYLRSIAHLEQVMIQF
jgi:E3 ubiquitin-protein ligase HUWE1